MCLGCELLKQIPEQIPASEFGTAVSVLCAGLLVQLPQEDRASFYVALVSSIEELIETQSTPKH